MRSAGVNFDLATLDIATVTERTLDAPVVNVGFHLGVPAKATNGFIQPMIDTNSQFILMLIE
jgi:hypothetical protein